MIKDFSFLNGLEIDEMRFDIWSPDNIQIVLGRSKKEEDDVFLEKAREDNIPIIRRETGGGTVLIDSGCIIVDIGYRAESRCRKIDMLQKANAIIAKMLNDIGIEAKFDAEWPDILVGECKICGSSLGIRNTNFLYSASLIYDALSIQMIDKYLKIPIRMPAYRNARNHRDFLISVNSLSEKSKDEIIAALRKNIVNDFYSI